MVWIRPNNPVIPLARVGARVACRGNVAKEGALGASRRGVVQVKKRTVPSGGSSGEGPKHIAAVESNVFAKLPQLVAHCAVTQYDDGSPRKPGWFTVKTMGSAWVVQVKEPDTALSMQCTAQSLDDALCLADLLLGSDDAPWEPDAFLRRQDAPKKKGG